MYTGKGYFTFLLFKKGFMVTWIRKAESWFGLKKWSLICDVQNFQPAHLKREAK